MKAKVTPTIIFVYDGLGDALHYIPEGGTIFDWTMRKDLTEHSCGKLINAIASTERSNPGNNIYIIPWDEMLRKLLMVRYDRVISIVPKYVCTDDTETYVGHCSEMVFRLDKGLTMDSIKPWMFKYELPKHKWLAYIFPGLKKFIGKGD